MGRPDSISNFEYFCPPSESAILASRTMEGMNQRRPTPDPDPGGEASGSPAGPLLRRQLGNLAPAGRWGRLYSLEHDAAVAIASHANAVAVLQSRLDARLPRNRHPPLLVEDRLAAATEFSVVLG